MVEKYAVKRSAGSLYGNQMAVVWRYLHADFIADFVDACSHHTDDVNFTVGTQFNEVADLPAHVTAVFNAALKMVHSFRRLEFILMKGIEALGADDDFHPITFRKFTFIFGKEDIAGLNFDP
jgi:hypothetical protein